MDLALNNLQRLICHRTKATNHSAASAKIYALTFSCEEITSNSLHMLDCTMLKELGIKTMGNVFAILKLTKEPSVSPVIHVKPPIAKFPHLNLEMTPQQLRKSRIDWDVFTKMTDLPPAQKNIQLNNGVNEVVQIFYHQLLPWVFLHKL